MQKIDQKTKTKIQKVLNRIETIKSYQKAFDVLRDECIREGLGFSTPWNMGFTNELDDLRIELCKLRGE